MRAFASIVVVAALAVSSFGATAMPIDPSLGVQSPTVSEARYGCGPEMTRGPYGHCRPRFSCPPGWHPGPEGWHCFRNY